MAIGDPFQRVCPWCQGRYVTVDAPPPINQIPPNPLLSDDQRLEEVIAKAVTRALKECGLDAFKETSLFLSNERRKEAE